MHQTPAPPSRSNFDIAQLQSYLQPPGAPQTLTPPCTLDQHHRATFCALPTQARGPAWRSTGCPSASRSAISSASHCEAARELGGSMVKAVKLPALGRLARDREEASLPISVAMRAAPAVSSLAEAATYSCTGSMWWGCERGRLCVTRQQEQVFGPLSEACHADQRGCACSAAHVLLCRLRAEEAARAQLYATEPMNTALGSHSRLMNVRMGVRQHKPGQPCTGLRCLTGRGAVAAPQGRRLAWMIS